MKRFLATTSMAVLLSTAALADNHAAGFATYNIETSQDIYASDFIGMRIYSAEQDFAMLDATSQVDADTMKNWVDIGEINDIVLGRDGDVKAVILGVGGFLGVGEKDVAVDMSSIKMVSERGSDDDFFLVVSADKQLLTDAPTFDRMMDESAAMVSKTSENVKTYAETVAKDTGVMMQDAKEKLSAAAAETSKRISDVAKQTEQAITPAMTHEGWATTQVEALTTEDLVGARVFGLSNEDIGEIDKLIVSDAGRIELAVLDIGGMLGIAEHRIAVDMETLQIMRQTDGDDVRVFISATQSELESRPEYRG